MLALAHKSQLGAINLPPITGDEDEGSLSPGCGTASRSSYTYPAAHCPATLPRQLGAVASHHARPPVASTGWVLGQ